MCDSKGLFWDRNIIELIVDTNLENIMADISK